jgi:hypothetical protein
LQNKSINIDCKRPAIGSRTAWEALADFYCPSLLDPWDLLSMVEENNRHKILSRGKFYSPFLLPHVR